MNGLHNYDISNTLYTFEIPQTRAYIVEMNVFNVFIDNVGILLVTVINTINLLEPL